MVHAVPRKPGGYPDINREFETGCAMSLVLLTLGLISYITPILAKLSYRAAIKK